MEQASDRTAYALVAEYDRWLEQQQLGGEKVIERAKERINRNDITADYVLLLAREVERQRRLNGELHKKMIKIKMDLEGGSYGD